LRRPMPAALAAAVLALIITGAALGADDGRIGPDLHIVNNGRHLTPYGRIVNVGNVPTGGALTPNGRFYWTVSAGSGVNDVRIVSVKSAKVVQTIALAGASGGVVIDRKGKHAYVSGLANSTNLETSRPDLPGGTGDVIHVFSISSSGKATETGQLPVPAPADAEPPNDFPLPSATKIGYPEFLDISPNGKTLVVPLNLANRAAIVDIKSRKVRYAKTGRYPYAAAVLPDGRRALVSNETTGTVSVIDLATAKVVKSITTGGHLSHPEAIAAPKGRRAYVSIANQDRVAVLDTKKLKLVKYVETGAKAGIGTNPNALAFYKNRVLVSEGGADLISVIDAKRLKIKGRIPTGRYPTDVRVSSKGTLVWLTAKGLGTGPNPNGPDPFHSLTLNQTGNENLQFLPHITNGDVGIGTFPSAKRLKSLTKAADKQLKPANLPKTPPAGTPIRSGGPIKHVFFIVRENRTYDQVLGDDTRGDGDPKLTLFGSDVTPNLHALAQRFPLVDHVYANSEASQDGHMWTSAANVSDHMLKSWQQISNVFGNYGARGRPLETGVLAVSFPPKGFLFDQAIRDNISFFNYGEAYAGNFPLPYPQISLLANTFDKDRGRTELAAAQAKFAKSDLGTPGRETDCFPNGFYIGADILTGKQVYDSSLPVGTDGESRTDCFRSRFAQQLASGSVPAFNYLTLTNDHTQGLSAGTRTPQAMIADNDLGTAQIIDTISHSAIWPETAIFVVEDDSQDGADHVDAHRIPALVVSPYARAGAVVNTRYDQVSVIRTMELILGMHPLSLNDALATPMYDAFQPSPSNIAPFDAITPSQDLNAHNPTTGPGARAASKLDFRTIDRVSQRTLDRMLWHAIHGQHATPPPPGPNATPEAEDDDG
jgi:YVTN family beta-propeller protein